MYIDHIRIENFRTFKKLDVRFIHPDLKDGIDGDPRPLLATTPISSREPRPNSAEMEASLSDL